MNTIKMTMVCVALVFGGSVVAWADDAPVTPSTTPPVVSTPALDAEVEKAAQAQAQAVRDKAAAGARAAVAPAPAPVPQRTWGQWGYGLASTTVKGVAYAGAQAGNAAMTCDSAALYPFGYVSDAAWSAACSADAYAESIRF